MNWCVSAVIPKKKKRILKKKKIRTNLTKTSSYIGTPHIHTYIYNLWIALICDFQFYNRILVNNFCLDDKVCACNLWPKIKRQLISDEISDTPAKKKKQNALYPIEFYKYIERELYISIKNNRSFATWLLLQTESLKRDI